MELFSLGHQLVLDHLEDLAVSVQGTEVEDSPGCDQEQAIRVALLKALGQPGAVELSPGGGPAAEQMGRSVSWRCHQLDPLD